MERGVIDVMHTEFFESEPFSWEGFVCFMRAWGLFSLIYKSPESWHKACNIDFNVFRFNIPEGKKKQKIIAIFSFRTQSTKK